MSTSAHTRPESPPRSGERGTERIIDDLTQLIGNTPLVRLHRFAESCGAELLAKVEMFNPGSSVKDRIGLAMIEAAEKRGELRPGSTIIEPTSGNTGIGLALVAATRGYRTILTMPESMSAERRKLLRALGAELVLTPADRGMKGAIEMTVSLAAAIPGSCIPGQFDNPANPEVHYRTTGPEIWRDTDGRVDVLVAGVGTGGTVSGAGRYLKEQNPDVRIVAVEPEESAVISGGSAGSHMIQGIGAGFIPKNLDTAVIDEVVRVDSFTAIAAAKELSRSDGLLVGISSGAAASAARAIGQRPGFEGKRIVVVMPDTAERYISTLLFYED